MAYHLIVCFAGGEAAGLAWLGLLGGLGYLLYCGFSAQDGPAFEGQDIELIEKQLEELLRLEAKLKADFSRQVINAEQYNKGLTRVLAYRKKLQAQMEDSIVAMISPDKSAQNAPAEVIDPLASAMAVRDADEQDTRHAPTDSTIKIINVVRGTLKEVRALEVKFLFHEKQAKAVIHSDEGQWHFSGQTEGLFHGLFLSGLEKSLRFAEVFEKEVSRHPDDWRVIIMEGKPYTKGGKQKNTRDNFPPVCRRIFSQVSESAPEEAPPETVRASVGGVDLTGEKVVIHKVDGGEYTQAQRRDFGRGLPEFPRYITILLDWGKYRLKAEMTTETGQWSVTPREPSHDYPQNVLSEFVQVIPFLMQELNQPRHKYLSRVIVTEMRRKEAQHQWEKIVTESSPLFWPHECRELFEKNEN